MTYQLTLTLESQQKRLYWEDSIISSDPRAANLREAFSFIRALVQGKAEYEVLPPARGGYL
jgi:hypothetical protein